MKYTILSIIGMVSIAFVFVAFTSNDQNKPWDVPEKYTKMENPQEVNKESLKIGKRLFNKHCKSCHGKEGLGDGTKAEQLDTHPGDFTSTDFQKQSDGVIFYKSWIGRDEMPNFEKKIPYEEDVWHVINYIRTMAE